MQEILKAIYQKHTFKITRQRYKHDIYKLYHQHPPRHSPNRYPTIASTQTTFNQTIQDLLPKYNQNQNRKQYKSLQLDNNKNIVKKHQTTKQFILPTIRKKSIKKPPNKFKSAAIAVYFITLLNRQRKKSMLKRKYRSQKISSNLLEIIDKMINNYYIIFLEQQLTNYLSLLQLKIDNPSLNINKEIINNLYFIAKRLSQSTIRKDFLDFLLTISKNNCFLPSDFLSQFQINRLQFSPVIGCLINVSVAQTKMIIGICIGIKLFCSYVLYRPWTLKINTIDFYRHYHMIGQTINSFGSVFYYLIMDQISKIPAIICQPSQKQILAGFGVSSIDKINIYPNRQIIKDIKSTSTDLIPNQSRQFLNKMIKIDRQKITSLKGFIIKWIDRITSVVIKNNKNQKAKKNK